MSKGALGALSLLAEYGGDSSDEEVPGCRFSTKRMHRDDEEPPSKRLERLPPPSFTVLNTEEVIDDPSAHEGRARSFPHERGNWATYVYVPYETNEGFERLLGALTSAAALENVELKYFEDFHLSLTRTVILKFHWIDSFVSTLSENLAHFTKFIIMFDNVEVYCNEEKTRTFIGLQIKTGYNSLVKLVQCLDSCLSEFKLPKFYEDPSFHISIAWCLGDCTDQLRPLLPVFNQDLENFKVELSQQCYIYVEQILCKTGNKVFQFQLS